MLIRLNTSILSPDGMGFLKLVYREASL